MTRQLRLNFGRKLPFYGVKNVDGGVGDVISLRIATDRKSVETKEKNFIYFKAL